MVNFKYSAWLTRILLESNQSRLNGKLKLRSYIAGGFMPHILNSSEPVPNGVILTCILRESVNMDEFARRPPSKIMRLARWYNASCCLHCSLCSGECSRIWCCMCCDWGLFWDVFYGVNRIHAHIFLQYASDIPEIVNKYTLCILRQKYERRLIVQYNVSVNCLLEMIFVKPMQLLCEFSFNINSFE